MPTKSLQFFTSSLKLECNNALQSTDTKLKRRCLLFLEKRIILILEGTILYHFLSSSPSTLESRSSAISPPCYSSDKTAERWVFSFPLGPSRAKILRVLLITEHAGDEDQKLKFDKQLRRLSQTQRANEEEVAGMPAPSTELSEGCFRTIGIVVR